MRKLKLILMSATADAERVAKYFHRLAEPQPSPSLVPAVPIVTVGVPVTIVALSSRTVHHIGTRCVQLTVTSTLRCRPLQGGGSSL